MMHINASFISMSNYPSKPIPTPPFGGGDKGTINYSYPLMNPHLMIKTRKHTKKRAKGDEDKEQKRLLEAPRMIAI